MVQTVHEQTGLWDSGGSVRRFLVEVFRCGFVEEGAFELGIEIRVECGRVERAVGVPGSKLNVNKSWEAGKLGSREASGAAGDARRG